MPDEPTVPGDVPASSPDEARDAVPAETRDASSEGADLATTDEGRPEAGRARPAAPDEETLLRIASPGVVRAAPRFGAFIAAGALLGLVLGVVLTTVLDTGAVTNEGGVLPFLAGANGVRAVTGLALAAAGALVGALLALWADRRSRRR